MPEFPRLNHVGLTYHPDVSPLVKDRMYVMVHQKNINEVVLFYTVNFTPVMVDYFPYMYDLCKIRMNVGVSHPDAVGFPTPHDLFRRMYDAGQVYVGRFSGHYLHEDKMEEVSLTPMSGGNSDLYQYEIALGSMSPIIKKYLNDHVLSATIPSLTKRQSETRYANVPTMMMGRNGAANYSDPYDWAIRGGRETLVHEDRLTKVLKGDLWGNVEAISIPSLMLDRGTFGHLSTYNKYFDSVLRGIEAAFEIKCDMYEDLLGNQGFCITNYRRGGGYTSTVNKFMQPMLETELDTAENSLQYLKEYFGDPEYDDDEVEEDNDDRY